MYGKRWFWIKFENYAIHLPSAPADTLLEVSWTAIDSSYKNLRGVFSALEKKYGKLWLKKYAPNFIDSTAPPSHVYYLRFEEYVCIDSAVKELENISGILNPFFLSYPAIPDFVQLKSNFIINEVLVPNPFRKETILEFTLNRMSYVTLAVYDELGRLVWGDGKGSSLEAGTHAIHLDGSSLPSGTLYARIATGFGEVKTVKLVHEK